MIPPHRSDPDLIVLHGLRCCGASSVERLGGIVAPLVDADVEDLVLDLAARVSSRTAGDPSAGGG